MNAHQRTHPAASRPRGGARPVVTILALALFLAVMVAPAVAEVPDPGIVCGNGSEENSLGYLKPAELDDIDGGTGSYEIYEGDELVGTLSWSGSTLNFTAEPGWTVDICLKGGATAPQEWAGVDSIVDYVHDFEISHLGYRNPVFTPPTGDLLVSKQVVGPAPANAGFSFSVNCEDGTEETFPLGDGDSELITDIEVGDCTVTETDTGGADTTTLDGEERDGDAITVAITENETTEVEIVNTFEEDEQPLVEPETGTLTVTKTVEGEAPDAVFSFSVNCADGTEEIFDLGGGESESLTDIEVGDCTVTETDTGGADTTTLDGEERAGDAITVAITEDETTEVVVVNTFEEIEVAPTVIVADEETETEPVDEEVEVLGVTEARALPRTGASPLLLVLLGLLAMGGGGGLLRARPKGA